MSYQTLEVEIENGRVRAAGSESLPAKARALLTILETASSQLVVADGPSMSDLMADSAGIGNGTHTDLSTNKAHMDDFGN